MSAVGRKQDCHRPSWRRSVSGAVFPFSHAPPMLTHLCPFLLPVHSPSRVWCGLHSRLLQGLPAPHHPPAQKESEGTEKKKLEFEKSKKKTRKSTKPILEKKTEAARKTVHTRKNDQEPGLPPRGRKLRGNDRHTNCTRGQTGASYRWRRWRRCISQTCMCRRGSPQVPRSPCRTRTKHRCTRDRNEINPTALVPRTGAHERACVWVSRARFLSLSRSLFSLSHSVSFSFSFSLSRFLCSRSMSLSVSLAFLLCLCLRHSPSLPLFSLFLAHWWWQRNDERRSKWRASAGGCTPHSQSSATRMCDGSHLAAPIRAHRALARPRPPCARFHRQNINSSTLEPYHPQPCCTAVQHAPGSVPRAKEKGKTGS